MEELFFRQVLLHYLQKRLPGLLSIILVGLVFALTHMHNVSLSEWIGAVGYLGWWAYLFYYLCERKGEYLLSPICSHVRE